MRYPEVLLDISLFLLLLIKSGKWNIFLNKTMFKALSSVSLVILL